MVDALATLAWDGRRASFFRPELMAALKILDHGDVTPARMTGSYAGAMGQPQFMPTSFLRYAVDFEGTAERDIWTNRPTCWARSPTTWRSPAGGRGKPGGRRSHCRPGSTPRATGRETRRPLAELGAAGRAADRGQWWGTAETSASVLLPDGAGGDAFVVYPNFGAIRRYNPSDYYALVVGLLGDALVV